MPQFDVSVFLPQFFWLIVIFGSLLIVMFCFVAPHIKMRLSQRELYLQDLYKQTQLSLLQTKELVDKIHLLKTQQEQKAKKTLNDLKVQLTLEKEQIITSLQNDLFIKRDKNLFLYQDELGQIQQEIPEIAKDLSSKLLESLVNNKQKPLSGAIA